MLITLNGHLVCNHSLTRQVLEFLRFKKFALRPHRVRNNRIMVNQIKKKDNEIKGMLNWLAKKREQ